MKKNLDLKSFILPILALVFVCSIMACLMAFTHSFTLPRIQANNAAKPDLKKELLPNATFEELDWSDETEAAFRTPNGEHILIIKAMGYNKSDPMQIMIGFDAKNNIIGIRFLKIAETEGIGSKVSEQEYLDQFIGKQDAKGIDAISGASISSKAMSKAINDATAILLERSVS